MNGREWCRDACPKIGGRGRCKNPHIDMGHEEKSNGTLRARLNGRGFEQVPGIHYDPKSISAPVVCMMTIRIVFILMLMAWWKGHVLDVRGAFLKGDFGDDETLYLHVPQGMKEWYSEDVYLLLNKTLYGLKQAAYRFWLFLLTIVRRLKSHVPKPTLAYTSNGQRRVHYYFGSHGSTTAFSQGPRLT
jgi:hypothetical protein